MRQRITGVCSSKHELLRGGQVGREGQKAPTAEKDKTTNSWALEANSGRMPRCGTRPNLPRGFQCVHVQESVLGQGPISADIKMPHKPSLQHPAATLERNKGRMLRILECISKWTNENLFLASSGRMGVRLVRKIRSVIEKGAKFYLHIQICEEICDLALYCIWINNPKTKNFID